jgi:hypothetical protein
MDTEKFLEQVGVLTNNTLDTQERARQRQEALKQASRMISHIGGNAIAHVKDRPHYFLGFTVHPMTGFPYTEQVLEKQVAFPTKTAETHSRLIFHRYLQNLALQMTSGQAGEFRIAAGAGEPFTLGEGGSQILYFTEAWLTDKILNRV